MRRPMSVRNGRQSLKMLREGSRYDGDGEQPIVRATIPASPPSRRTIEPRRALLRVRRGKG